ncbi:Alpha/beta hydrolase fold-1 [Mycena filopes]|nr:Alpha/beta hydrolase fold-1 [Mycena filopes]
MSALSSQSYVFDPRPDIPLLITAKRYWDPASPDAADPTALTLIFGHATGFHKETVEPALDDLYALLQQNGATESSARPKIREAWSIECPNHGEAALLNEATLRWGYEPVFPWQEYGRGIHAFLAGLGTGVDVDFSQRRLVLIGHSFAATAMALALTYHPPLKPEQLILLEPMCVRPESHTAVTKFLRDGSEKRRDIWASREEAYALFKARRPWKNWDERVLRKYVEHALTPLPSLEYPDKEGVTLQCTRKQETASYNEWYAGTAVYRFFPHLVKRFPTHVLYGGVPDYLPQEEQDAVVGESMGGVGNLASFGRIAGAGHMAMATHPREVARALYDILAGSSSFPLLLPARARL